MINLFSRHFPPPHDGGGQLYYKNLVTRLDGRIRFFTHRNAMDLDNENIETIKLPFVPQARQPNSGWKLYWSFFVSILYFTLRKSDLFKNGIHLGQLWPYGMIGLILNRLFGVKYTIFILGEELSMIVYGRGIKINLIAKVYRMIIKKANHVFVSSSFVRDNVKRLLEGHSTENVSIFYSGFEPDIFCDKEWKYHSHFCPTDDEVVLFSVSRHIERKGFDTLIEASRLLKDKADNWN